MKNEFDFDFDSFEELRNGFDQMAKKFPDYAENSLRKEGEEFKKAVRKEALQATDKHSGNLTKGFRLSPVRNVGGIIQQDFMAEGQKNPHWHLIEKGHEIVTPFTRKGKKLKNGGKVVGFVPGRRIIPNVLKAWGPKHEERIRHVLANLKKEVDL